MKIHMWGRPCTSRAAAALRLAAQAAHEASPIEACPQWDEANIVLAAGSARPAPGSLQPTNIYAIRVDVNENGVPKAELHRVFPGVVVLSSVAGDTGKIGPEPIVLNVALCECDVDLNKVGVVSDDPYTLIVPLVDLVD